MVVVPYAGYTTEEVARRGWEIYDRELREEVEPEHSGRFLVLDVESGDYEIADEDRFGLLRSETLKIPSHLRVSGGHRPF